MALTSVYYDGPVTEVDRAQDLAGAPEYGVYGPGDFKVTAHPSIPYAVLVKAGRAHGHGVTDTADVDQVVQCATLASGTRWDLITVRRNWQPALGGPSTLVALQSGTTPVIPASRKVGAGVEDDQPLALVRWSGGLSAPEEIIDLRVWAGNGSLVAVHDLVRSYMTTPGTRICIAGVDWIRSIGDNDVPAWVPNKFDKSLNAGAHVGLTALKTGWTRPFTAGNAKPRVWSTDGITAHSSGLLQFNAGGGADMIGIPAEFAPTASEPETFIGTTQASDGPSDTVGGAILTLAIKNGVLKIAYQSKTVAIGSYVPITGTWRISG